MARRITNEGKWGTTTSAPTATNITTVLTTVNTDNYPATIAGQIDRIGDAHEIIQAKAYSMLLNVQANQGDSKPSSNIRLQKDGTHKIMDTASAINSIVVNTSENKTPEHGATVTINKGYYTSNFTVKSKGTHSSSDQSDITAANTLEGTEGWTSDGTRVAGSLADKSGNQNAGNKNYYTGTDSKTYLALTIPATGKYAKDSLLISDIIYNNTGIEDGIQQGPSWNPQVEITKTTNAETNESGLTINSLTIPAGYYSSAITIKPILSANDESNKIINTTTYTASGAVTNAAPPTGYDYFTKVTVPAVGTFSINDKTTTPVSVGSYDTTNNVYPVSVSNLQGKFSTAGWATNSAYTDSSVIVGTLPKAGHSITQSSSATGSGPTAINQQYFKDVITAGYLTASTNHYKVTDGSISALTATFDPETAKVTVSGGTVTAGWISENVTLPTDVSIGLATVSGTGTKQATSPTIAQGAAYTKDTTYKADRITSTPTTSKPTSGYYVAIQATAPATTAISVKQTNASAGYIDLAANATIGTASTTAKTGNVYYAPIAASQHTWGDAFAATDANTGLTAGNWYVPCEITAGYTSQKTEYLNLGAGSATLKDLTTETNVGLAQTTVLENLTSDTTFTAADGKFFHSMKVEVAGVIAKLQAI